MTDRPSKALNFFLKIGPFPAVIFFQIWAGPGRPPHELLPVAALALVYCGAVMLVSHGRGGPGYFDYALTTYFALVTAALFIRPDQAGQVLRHYAATGIFLALFTAAFLPPLLGRPPFTIHFAKKSTPAENWNNPVFIRINEIMGLAWSSLFFAAMILTLFPAMITRVVLPNLLFLGVGFPFNKVFPNYYLKRQGLPSLAEQRARASESPPSGTPGRSFAFNATTAWEVVSHMPDAFNPQAAGELSAVIGFNVSGSETFEAYLIIKDGQCTLDRRTASPPDLTIHTPAQVWLDISQGRLDGQEAFMTQAYRGEGDLGLLMNLKNIFSNHPQEPIAKDDRKQP